MWNTVKKAMVPPIVMIALEKEQGKLSGQGMEWDRGVLFYMAKSGGVSLKVTSEQT